MNIVIAKLGQSATKRPQSWLSILCLTSTILQHHITVA